MTKWGCFRLITNCSYKFKAAAPSRAAVFFCSTPKKTARWPVSRVLYPFAWAMTIHLRRLLPGAWRDLPGWRPGNMPAARSGAIPIWSCSRRGLPCRACCQPRGALLPHPFTLTLITEGGLLSVALSLGLPPPGITRHRVSVEPGLSSPA